MNDKRAKRLGSPRIVEVKDGIVRLIRRYNRVSCGYREDVFPVSSIRSIEMQRKFRHVTSRKPYRKWGIVTLFEACLVWLMVCGGFFSLMIYGRRLALDGDVASFGMALLVMVVGTVVSSLLFFWWFLIQWGVNGRLIIRTDKKKYVIIYHYKQHSRYVEYKRMILEAWRRSL